MNWGKGTGRATIESCSYAAKSAENSLLAILTQHPIISIQNRCGQHLDLAASRYQQEELHGHTGGKGSSSRFQKGNPATKLWVLLLFLLLTQVEAEWQSPESQLQQRVDFTGPLPPAQHRVSFLNWSNDAGGRTIVSCACANPRKIWLPA